MKFPKSINDITNGLKAKLITDFHVSGDEVYNFEDKYILKVSKNITRLIHEKKYNDLIKDRLPVCESIMLEVIEDKAYYLKSYIDGESLCTDKYLSNPKLLISLLEKAINMLHSVKNQNGETFIHGDLCLPNILVKNNEIVGFIDLSESTFSTDLWLDYAWLIWSFEFNLKTKKYTNALLKALNIKFDEERYQKAMDGF